MGKNNRFLRTCIVCNKKGTKVEFFRLALKEGVVLVDKKKCLSGRGAYVCSLECLKKLQKSQLERALKCKVIYDGQIIL